MSILLKLIPKKVIILAVWKILDPILLKKIAESDSKIDDAVYVEISAIIERLLSGLEWIEKKQTQKVIKNNLLEPQWRSMEGTSFVLCVAGTGYKLKCPVILP